MKEKYSRKKSKTKSKTKRIFLWIFIILLTIIIGVGVAGSIFVKGKLDKINYVEIKEEEIEVNQGVELKKKGYRNIAILGVDARKDTYEGTRSDGIIIASINQETNDVKLVSIFRDTYVAIDGHGLDKITHAYAYGGAKLAINTINKNLDLDIKEFITVNFFALIDIVDEIGGVTVDVEKEALKQTNQYIQDMHIEMKTPNDQLKSAGVHNLSGVQALGYSRVRYTEGGDERRTERMRIVLTAIFDKIKTMGTLKLNSVIDKVLPKISTNISSGDILALLPQITKFKMNGNLGWPYETKGITLNAWYGVPVTLESNVIKLHEEMFENQDYTVSDFVKKTSDSIIKKTGYKIEEKETAESTTEKKAVTKK